MDFTSPTVTKLLSSKDDEVTINLAAPIRLCALFTPRLLKKERAAIVNVSSGLAFVPIAMMPIYCATKAAIHSFTISLRHQLRNTSVRVFEAAPPTTDTELDRNFAGENEQAYRGISAHEVATAITDAIQTDKEEMLIGEAQGLHQAATEPRSHIQAVERLVCFISGFLRGHRSTTRRMHYGLLSTLGSTRIGAVIELATRLYLRAHSNAFPTRSTETALT